MQPIGWYCVGIRGPIVVASANARCDEYCVRKRNTGNPQAAAANLLQRNERACLAKSNLVFIADRDAPAGVTLLL
jgi:hypothetical protein